MSDQTYKSKSEMKRVETLKASDQKQSAGRFWIGHWDYKGAPLTDNTTIQVSVHKHYPGDNKAAFEVVLAEDYEALQKECERLRAEVASETVKVERAIFQAMELECDELKAENQALREMVHITGESSYKAVCLRQKVEIQKLEGERAKCQYCQVLAKHGGKEE